MKELIDHKWLEKLSTVEFEQYVGKAMAAILKLYDTQTHEWEDRELYKNITDPSTVHTSARITREINSTLIEYIDSLIQLSNDIEKGSFNGRRKLDIDLSLNKVGVNEAVDTETALAIWQNERTTVYYSKAQVAFKDGVNIVVQFVNDDNNPIQISTAAELGFQLNKNTNFTDKLTNTSLITDASGKVGNLLRITDLGNKASNIESVKLFTLSGDFVKKEPVYTWLDTTSVLIVLFSLLDVLKNLPTNLIEFDEHNQAILEIEEMLRTIYLDITGKHYRVIRGGRITDPVEIAEDGSMIYTYIELKEKVLYKENNLSDLPDKEEALKNLGFDEIHATGGE